MLINCKAVSGRIEIWMREQLRAVESNCRALSLSRPTQELLATACIIRFQVYLPTSALSLTSTPRRSNQSYTRFVMLLEEELPRWLLLQAAEARVVSHTPAPLALTRPLNIHPTRSSQVEIEHAIV